MAYKFVKPMETNRPRDETPHSCYQLLQQARRSFHQSKSFEPNKDKMFESILAVREHEEHMGCRITPLSEFGVTKQELQEWLVSDPKRTGKMLRDFLVITMNQEISQSTKAIKEKYSPKLHQYWDKKKK